MKSIHRAGFLVFVMTGTGLMIRSVLGQPSTLVFMLCMVAVAYAYGLTADIQKLQFAVQQEIQSSDALLTVFLAAFSAALTWYLNHAVGLGPVVASGLVGVMAGLLLPTVLSGTVYTASFVGMSASMVLTGLWMSVISGVFVGIILVITVPVFAGIGGKGGTSAATAVLLTRSLFGS